MVHGICFEGYHEFSARAGGNLRVLGDFKAFVYVLVVAVETINMVIFYLLPVQALTWVYDYVAIEAEHWCCVFPRFCSLEPLFHLLAEDDVRRDDESLHILLLFAFFLVLPQSISEVTTDRHSPYLHISLLHLLQLSD